jgi:hypothetical protein
LLLPLYIIEILHDKYRYNLKPVSVLNKMRYFTSRCIHLRHYERFEDVKEIFKSCKWKDRQYNEQGKGAKGQTIVDNTLHR